MKFVPCSTLARSDAVVEKQPLDCSTSGMDSMGGGNNVNSNANFASKHRLRWTHELHEQFVDAVAQLGGPDSKCFLILPYLYLLLEGNSKLWISNGKD